MKIVRLIPALILAACAAPPPGAEQPQQPPRELAGRVAGAPEHCVLIRQAEALRVSDTNSHILLYGSGRTIWSNNLGPGCGFRFNDILITEPIGSNFCRGDLIRSVDRLSHIPGPACVLNDFIPHTRP
jgi:hypothetical protein